MTTETGAAADPEPVPERTAEPVPVPRRDWNTVGQRIVVGFIVVGLSVVLSAPVLMSATQLAEWGRESLSLDDWLRWLVPGTGEAAIALCIGLTYHATIHAESAVVPRLLIWGFAGVTAWAQYRHGETISNDAAVYFPALPLLSALLLEQVLRRVRRAALRKVGALEPPLPRYRIARWAWSPVETFRAWRVAVKEGLTSPTDAIAVVRGEITMRRGRIVQDEPVPSDLVPDPPVDQGPRPELAPRPARRPMAKRSPKSPGPVPLAERRTDDQLLEQMRDRYRDLVKGPGVNQAMRDLGVRKARASRLVTALKADRETGTDAESERA